MLKAAGHARLNSLLGTRRANASATTACEAFSRVHHRRSAQGRTGPGCRHLHGNHPHVCLCQLFHAAVWRMAVGQNHRPLPHDSLGVAVLLRGSRGAGVQRPGRHGPRQTVLLYTGMALIAFGSGGIKPCVSAFVGDQFKPEQSHLLQKAYGAFYWAINLGSFFSFLVIPGSRTGMVTASRSVCREFSWLSQRLFSGWERNITSGYRRTGRRNPPGSSRFSGTRSKSV